MCTPSRRGPFLTLSALLLSQAAMAHSVAQVQTAIYLAPDTVTMLTERAVSGTPGLVQGDVVSYIVQFTPVENGAFVGPNGYVTAYLPAGVEVVDAAIVAKQSDGSFVAVPPTAPGPMPNGWGARGRRTFTTGNAAWASLFVPECSVQPLGQCNGSLAQLYADTGIFYSDDSRTGVFVSPSTDGRVRQGTNGYDVSPTGEGQLNPILDQARATTHNLWDAAQTNAFGSTNGAVTSLTAPASPALSVSNGQGAAPFGAGSPVAGPETGYSRDNLGVTGPWKRIAYPGSRIGLTSEGPATSENGTGTGTSSATHIGGAPTSVGFVLSSATPLPSATNALRFAVGRLDVGQLKYVRFTVRLTAPPPTTGVIMNSEVFGGDSAQAAGKVGQDNPWRYAVPSVADNNSNLFVIVQPVAVDGDPFVGSTLPVDSIVTYRVTYLNTGNSTQQNVVLKNLLPDQVAGTVTAVRILSGPDIRPIAPAAPAAGGTFTFQPIATLVPGSGGSVEFDVRVAGATGDIVADAATVTSTQLPDGVTFRSVSMISDRAELIITKAATPSSRAPGSTLSYTLTIKNDGAANATSLRVTDLLPTAGGSGAANRFEYVAGSSVVTGLTSVTPVVTTPPTDPMAAGQNRVQLTWDFGAQILTPGQTLTLTVNAVVGGSVTTGTYRSDVIVSYDNSDFVAEARSFGIAPVVVDGTPPATAFDVTEPNPTSDPTGDFDFSSNEGGVTYECRLGAAAFAPCTEVYSTPTLTNGTYTLEVRAKDVAGNVDATPASHTWTVDTTAPDTDFDAAEPALTSDDTADFDFGSDEANVTYECRLGTAPFAPCAELFSTTTLLDGTYVIEVRARDAAGNVDATPATYTWTLDTTPPSTAFDVTPDLLTTDTTGEFDFASDEPDVTYECRLGDDAFAECAELWATPALLDGTYTVEVRAIDAAGNVDPTPASFTWTVDTTPPTTGFDSAEPSPTTDPTGDFDFASDDPAATFECRLGQDAFVPCPELFVTSELTGGTYTLEVRARDLAGNVDPSPAVVTWTVDTTAPDTSFDAVEPDPTADPTGDFDFASNEVGVTYECRTAAADFAPCPELFSTVTLLDGVHTLEVRARDAAGNVDPTPASYTWSVDTTPPDTLIDAAEPLFTADASGDFEFGATEDGVTWECRVGDAAFAPCPETFSTASLPDGTYTLEVRAIDAASNVDDSPAAHTWTVDTTPPDTSFDDAEPDPTIDPTGDFDFGSTEPGSTFECRLGDAPFAPCDELFTTDTLAEGTYTLEVRAVDAAGNVDPTPASHSWTVELADPELDGDQDGVLDVDDNCPTVANGLQEDLDGDDLGDACDPDRDDDGVKDDGDGSGVAGDVPCANGETDACDDNCTVDPNPTQIDADDDGLGNACDPDSDGDGVDQGLGDEPCIAGEVVGCDDNCPLVPNADQADADADGVGDLCEDDDDGDGVPRTEDAPCVTGVTAGCSDNCPEVPNSEQTDTDGDGDGDDCDSDDDDDGVLDGDDNCPFIANEAQADGDADGLGDACDAPGPSDDRDADGVADDVDNCPDDANERQDDLDDDGVGDTCDPDGDGDGVLDTIDNCHRVPNADQADWDGNGVGEACQGVGLGVTGGACSTSVGSRERRPLGWVALLIVGLAGWFWRRRRASVLGVALLLAFGPLTPDANAQTGGAVSTFHPSPFMQDLITVQKATTRKAGSWNVGMLLEYQRNPLVLRDTASDEIVRKIVSDTVFAHVRGAYAVTDWCDLGLVLPIIAFQAGDGLGGGAEPGVAGIGDLELAARFRLFRTEDRRFALALTPTLTAPTGRLVDESMGSPSVTFTPWIGLSYDLPVFGVAFGLGYRVMKDSTIADLTLEDELLFRLGISVPVSESVVLLAEVEGGTAATSPFADAGRTPMEARAGVRVLAAPSFSVDVGAGAGLTQGYASPDFRVYAGFNFFREPPGDRDGDGLMDEDDACPDDPEDRDGLEDADGCPEPDNDRDRICDPWVAERPASAPKISVCRGSDRCPESPEDADGFEDDNGCPDPDNDKDGIPDTKDACALEPEDVDGTVDEDGCPDPDDDADGICDGWVVERQQQAAYEALCKGVDKCPKVAETVNEIEDDDGCPDELAHVEGNKIIIKDKIYFFYGKAVIMPKSDPVLAAVLKIMSTNPQIKRVRIEGHTDTRGPAGRNKALSAARAKAVLKYLVKRGVAPGRLISEGFGESTPIVPVEKTEEEFELNRRVEFTILDE